MTPSLLFTQSDIGYMRVFEPGDIALISSTVNHNYWAMENTSPVVTH